MLLALPSRPQMRYDGLVLEDDAVGVLFTVTLLKSFGVPTATPVVTRTARDTIDVQYRFWGPTRLVDSPVGVHAGVLDGVLINSIVSGSECVYAVTEGDDLHRRVVSSPYRPADGAYHAVSKAGHVEASDGPSYRDLLTEGELYEQYEQLRRQVKAARAHRAEGFLHDLRPHLTDQEYGALLTYEAAWTEVEQNFFRTWPAMLSVRSMLLWGDGRTVDVNPEVRRQHVLRMLTVRPFFPAILRRAVESYQNSSGRVNRVERNIERTRTDDERTLNMPLNVAINMCEGLPIKQVLFRREREPFPDDLKVGDVFYKNNVTSTTVTPQMGQFGPVLMIIEVPAGFPTLATLTVGSHMQGEAEVMLPVGCAYVVLEKHKGPEILHEVEMQSHSLETLDRIIAKTTGTLRARLDRVRARVAQAGPWDRSALNAAIRAEWAPRADARVHTMIATYTEVIVLRVISAPTIPRRFPALSYPPVRSQARAREIGDLVAEAVMERRAEAFALPADLLAALAEPGIGEFRAASEADITWMTLMRHLPLHVWTALQHLSARDLSPQVLRVANAGAAWGIFGRVMDEFFRTDAEDTMSLDDVIGIVEEHWDTRADPLVSPMSGRWTLEAAYAEELRTHPGKIPRRYEGRVRVMTYNVHEFNNRATLDVISAANPDILLLQEATPADYYRIFPELMSRLNYTHRKMCVGWSNFGNILCTRLDVLSEPETMDLPRGPRENRCAVRVKVQLPNGPPLWVIVTHLDVFDESGDTRDRQAKYLADTWVAPAVQNGEEVLLAGDMNEVYLPEMLVSRAELLRAAHRDRTQHELSTRAVPHFRRHLFDVFDAAGTQPPPFTVWSLTRVDHMLVTPRVACRVVRACAPQVEGSDHLPIIVDLEYEDVKYGDAVTREESKGNRVFLEREQIWMETAADGTRRYSLREDGQYLAPPAADFTMRFLRREDVWVASRGAKIYAWNGEKWMIYRKT